MWSQNALRIIQILWSKSGLKIPAKLSEITGFIFKIKDWKWHKNCQKMNQNAIQNKKWIVHFHSMPICKIGPRNAKNRPQHCARWNKAICQGNQTQFCKCIENIISVMCKSLTIGFFITFVKSLRPSFSYCELKY